MGRVRKTSRLGKKKINTTAYGRKNKKKNNKGGYTIKMSNIRERWVRSLSMKNNLKNLGLVYDINSDIKPYPRRTKKKSKVDQIEFMDISEATAAENTDIAMEGEDAETEIRKPKRLKGGAKARTLHEEFKKRSDRRNRKTCHLSTLETEYLLPLIQKHGTDYGKMARDKGNFDQLTETQLKKKCEELLSSRETRHLNKFRELGLIA